MGGKLTSPFLTPLLQRFAVYGYSVAVDMDEIKLDSPFDPPFGMYDART